MKATTFDTMPSPGDLVRIPCRDHSELDDYYVAELHLDRRRGNRTAITLKLVAGRPLGAEIVDACDHGDADFPCPFYRCKATDRRCTNPHTYGRTIDDPHVTSTWCHLRIADATVSHRGQP